MGRASRVQCRTGSLCNKQFLGERGSASSGSHPSQVLEQRVVATREGPEVVSWPQLELQAYPGPFPTPNLDKELSRSFHFLICKARFTLALTLKTSCCEVQMTSSLQSIYSMVPSSWQVLKMLDRLSVVGQGNL